MLGRDATHESTIRDFVSALMIALTGGGLRIAFVERFPTIAFSDFRRIVEFGLLLDARGVTAPGPFWAQLNAGLPTILSGIFRAAPAEPSSIARLTTAVATGIVLPLLPFVLWRSVVPYRIRLVAAILLAVWPGQVFFSGVVAQDNWVLLPTVALAAIAVRRLRAPGERGHPVAAGILLAIAVWIRQEMVLVLSPLLIAASLPARSGRRRWRGPLLSVAASVLCLGLVAGQRWIATGRFSITTEHGGVTLLGSVVPGASGAGWIDPKPFVASVEPGLLVSRERLYAGASSLAFHELRRRPMFHAFRMAAAALRLSAESDADNLFWSVEGAGVLPAAARPGAESFAQQARPWLRAELALMQGLAIAAVVIGFRLRRADVLVVAAAAFLKLGIQAVVSPMGRMAVPAVGLELLAIALALESVPSLSIRERTSLAAVAMGLGAMISLSAKPLAAAVLANDRHPTGIYRFPLPVDQSVRRVECSVTEGRLVEFDWSSARVEAEGRNAGTYAAEAVCGVPPVSRGAIALRLTIHPLDGSSAAPRMRVSIAGRDIPADASAVPDRPLFFKIGPGAEETRTELQLESRSAGTSFSFRFCGVPESDGRSAPDGCNADAEDGASSRGSPAGGLSRTAGQSPTVSAVVSGGAIR